MKYLPVLAAALLQFRCASAVKAPPTWTLDPDFPGASPVTFANVTWSAWDSAKAQLVLLQRGAAPVTWWTADGTCVSQWNIPTLGDPHSLKLSQSTIWITDMAPPLLAGISYGHCLKQFSMDGTLSNTLGTCGENSQGSGLNPVQFDKVTDVAFDSSGNLFVADGDIGGLNNRVLHLTPQGTVLDVWSAPNNQPGKGPKEFNLPHALQVDGCDRVWIADALNNRIQVVTAAGEYIGSMNCFGTDGVYGLAIVPSGMQTAWLFVTTSPVTNPTGGTVHVFSISRDCSASPLPACSPIARWPITFPPTPSTAMLHSIAVDPATYDVYISALGGTLPPQRWVLSPQK